MSRLPAQLQCSHLPHPLCTSLLPSGVAITAEARKQSRGCFKTARDPLPLQPRGWARGSVPPISTQPQHGPQLLALNLGTASLPGSGRTCSRTTRPPDLQHIRDAAAGLGEGRAPQQWVLPAPMPHAEPCWVQRPSLSKHERHWGRKTPEKGGQRARERRYLPHPSTPAW